MLLICPHKILQDSLWSQEKTNSLKFNQWQLSDFGQRTSPMKAYGFSGRTSALNSCSVRGPLPDPSPVVILPGLKCAVALFWGTHRGFLFCRGAWASGGDDLGLSLARSRGCAAAHSWTRQFAVGPICTQPGPSISLILSKRSSFPLWLKKKKKRNVEDTHD